MESEWNNKICKICKIPLRYGENWPIYFAKNQDYLCYDCKRKRERDNYHKNSANRLNWTKIYYQKNKEKYKDIARKYYIANQEKIKLHNYHYYITHKDRMHEIAEQGRQQYRKKWFDIINKKGMDHCSRCGYNENFAALDFHHINPKNKEIDIGRILNLKIIPKRIKELDKCITLCANCHRVEHNKNKSIK